MSAAVVYTEAGVRTYDDVVAAKEAHGTTWVRMTDYDTDELASIAEAFDLHDLTVDDVRNNVRSKVEEFPEYTFALVKEAELMRGEQTFLEEIADEALGLFVGEDWLVTLSLTEIGAVDRTWDAVARGDERLLQRGPDFAAYRILDRVVDEYFDILDHIESAIERIEEEVLVSTDIETLEGINRVRRDLLAFRKVAWPMREVAGVFARGDPAQVQQPTEKYFRDVYDQLVQVVDLTETYRDLTAGTRDIYLNTLSQSTNEVMKTLTVVATIVLPLTFIAGVYGMNFAGGPYNMPELGWQFGYPAVMAGMAAVAAIMVAYFRHVDWL